MEVKNALTVGAHFAIWAAVLCVGCISLDAVAAVSTRLETFVVACLSIYGVVVPVVAAVGLVLAARVPRDRGQPSGEVLIMRTRNPTAGEIAELAAFIVTTLVMTWVVISLFAPIAMPPSWLVYPMAFLHGGLLMRAMFDVLGW